MFVKKELAMLHNLTGSFLYFGAIRWLLTDRSEQLYNPTHVHVLLFETDAIFKENGCAGWLSSLKCQNCHRQTFYQCVLSIYYTEISILFECLVGAVARPYKNVNVQYEYMYRKHTSLWFLQRILAILLNLCPVFMR